MESIDSNGAAIVSTVRGSQEMIVPWIGYHLALGFAHLFLFFDDANEGRLWLEQDHFDPSKVTIILNDAQLLELYKELESFSSLEPFRLEEVQARQHLNAEAAIKLCLKKKISWLLHIDIDELFHCEDLPKHLAHLSSNNIGTLTYVNHEAVPETPFIGDPFTEVTLFKRHLSSVQLAPDSLSCLSFWKNRTTYGQYFLAYDVGKSIVRVCDAVAPESVHKWKLDKSSSLRRVSSIVDVRSLDLENIFPVNDAFILHYVSCGYLQWKKKYEVLASFPDSWFGGKLKIHPCFHLLSRDTVGKRDEREMFEFYTSQMVLKSEPEAHKQVASQLCLRLSRVQEILAGLKPHPASLLFIKHPSASVQLEKARQDYVFVENYFSAEVNSSASGDTAPSKEIENSKDNEKTGPRVSDQNLSLDQMWIISSLMQQYLVPEKK